MYPIDLSMLASRLALGGDPTTVASPSRAMMIRALAGQQSLAGPYDGVPPAGSGGDYNGTGQVFNRAAAVPPPPTFAPPAVARAEGLASPTPMPATPPAATGSEPLALLTKTFMSHQPDPAAVAPLTDARVQAPAVTAPSLAATAQNPDPLRQYDVQTALGSLTIDPSKGFAVTKRTPGVGMANIPLPGQGVSLGEYQGLAAQGANAETAFQRQQQLQTELANIQAGARPTTRDMFDQVAAAAANNAAAEHLKLHPGDYQGAQQIIEQFAAARAGGKEGIKAGLPVAAPGSAADVIAGLSTNEGVRRLNQAALTPDVLSEVARRVIQGGQNGDATATIDRLAKIAAYGHLGTQSTGDSVSPIPIPAAPGVGTIEHGGSQTLIGRLLRDAAGGNLYNQIRLSPELGGRVVPIPFFEGGGVLSRGLTTGHTAEAMRQDAAKSGLILDSIRRLYAQQQPR